MTRNHCQIITRTILRILKSNYITKTEDLTSFSRGFHNEVFAMTCFKYSNVKH